MSAERKCPECGKPFASKLGHRQIYCSKACSTRGQSRKHLKALNERFKPDWALDMESWAWKNTETGEVEGAEG